MRATEAADRGAKSVAELDQIVRGAIGEGAVGLAPDVLGGVEFGRIGGEEVHVQPGMARAEALDVAAPVDGATVPEQIDGAPAVAQQVAKEGLDVEAGEIAGAAVEIERDLAPAGRHRHLLDQSRHPASHELCLFHLAPG